MNLYIDMFSLNFMKISSMDSEKINFNVKSYYLHNSLTVRVRDKKKLWDDFK